MIIINHYKYFCHNQGLMETKGVFFCASLSDFAMHLVFGVVAMPMSSTHPTFGRCWDDEKWWFFPEDFGAIVLTLKNERNDSI